jgi:glycerate 2-kinase
MNKRDLIDIFNAALSAADPYRAVMKTVSMRARVLLINERAYDLDDFDRVLVVGAGKATARMARAVEDILGNELTDGLIIVKYGHTAPLRTIRQVEAAHPLPDEAGVQGTERIVDLLKSADDTTLVICLLSGGGSALLAGPADGITLSDKQSATDTLIRAGATIDELNTVRKHMSSVKGGRLTRIAYPATLATLILSDVIGDRLDVIASGPTVPDGTTYNDALNVVDKYSLRAKLPKSVIGVLESGAQGRIPDTPKAGDACFNRSHTIIVGSLSQALSAARDAAERSGYHAEIITARLQGEAKNAARYLAETARMVRGALKDNDKPRCLISGGETTVTVSGKGLGGRNQELALAFALEIEGTRGITMLSAGTDGSDGPTDAAGAIVDGETVARARIDGIDPALYLNNNDSYSFFDGYDRRTGEQSHLKTGPTGTNVMDVQIILVDTSPAGWI